jgi:restriction endonuclease Mrr
MTGDYPSTVPLTAKEYTDNGFPWFEYYDGVKEKILLPDYEVIAQQSEDYKSKYLDIQFFFRV